MIDRKEIELLIRAQLDGKGNIKEVAKSIGELEKAIESQATAAKKGESDLEKLLVGLRSLQRDAKSAAQALGSTLDFQRQTESLEKYGQRLTLAKGKLDAFNATLPKTGELSERQVNQQTRLGAAVDRASAAYDKAKGRLQATADVMQRFGIDTNKLADEQTRLVAAISNANFAIKGHEDAIDKATAAQARMANAKTALGSITAQVAALASAWIGVHQAVRLADGSIDAFSSREGVKNQLALSVGNDKQSIDAEYAYVKGQADRIGIEFDTAAKGYAKFAAAAKLAGRDRQEIRFIWEAFAEVGRVANLSREDLDGVFKALEQITSKGKIQAEELRGQLGDRLFGAFQIAAQALKDQFPDLDKAMKDGLVTSEQLVAIAEQYRKTVADQLPAATAGLAAQQARFTNAVLEFKLAIADAGFADGFTRALQAITAALKSEDGKKLAEGIAAGFSAAADAAAWLVRNANEVLTVLKALAGLWALNAAGKAVAGVVEYAGSLKALAGDLKTAVNGLGLVRGAFAALQAALLGWSIGTWANEEFSAVRKAGVLLVTGLDEGWTRIKAGAEILWEEVPRFAQNAFSKLINFATFGMRAVLGIFQKGLEALGQPAAAKGVGLIIDSLTAKYEEQGSRVAQIHRKLAEDVKRIRAIQADMLADAGATPGATAPPAAQPAAQPTPRPALKNGKTGNTGPTDADIAKRQRLVEEITRALETLDAKIDRTQTDTLQAQLDAIDEQYAALSRKIATLGGQTGAEFMARLDASLNQLREQTIAKFNGGLATEHAALLGKLEALDAAAGRKSKTDLEARLAAIASRYEAAYREIADFRARLEANGRSTADADTAKQRLDAGLAELKQIETQRFYKDELRRLEGQINDALATRSDHLKTIRDQEAASLITSAEARTQTEAAVTAMQPQIATLVDLARPSPIRSAAPSIPRPWTPSSQNWNSPGPAETG
jgi:tape measure domain-containing protein